MLEMKIRRTENTEEKEEVKKKEGRLLERKWRRKKEK